MMKKYTIAIEETVVKEFEVEASDFEEALDIAEKKYHEGEFVLSSGEVHFKQMAVVEPQSEATEWNVF